MTKPIDPFRVEELIQRALIFTDSGRLVRAAKIYSGLIKRGVRSARVFTNYGAVTYHLGDKEQGRELLESAIQADPDYLEAWTNLSIDANLTNNDTLFLVSAAILEQNPSHALARIAQAESLMLRSDYIDAISLLSLLPESEADNIKVHKIIARCGVALGDYDLACSHLFYIVSLDPGNPFASIELSDIAIKAGDHVSSLEILERACKYNPSDYALNLKLAHNYQSAGLFQKAIDYYSLALENDAQSHVVLGSMAYCYAEMGMVDTFIDLYEKILDQGIEIPEVIVPLIFICSTLGSSFHERLERYSRLYWNARKRHRVDQLIADEEVIQRRQADHASLPLRHQVTTRKRIGFITGDLGIHVVSTFLASFVLNYSKDLFHVEIISNQWRKDQVADVLSGAVDHCMSIAEFQEEKAKQVIRSREYDVIIETSGFTSGSAIHLLDERCAPIQCHWIGYHASTFMPTMDYFIGDHVMTPASLSHMFSERIARLPRAWLAATPFTVIPEAARTSLGGDIILGSFSQVAKLKKKTLSLWAKVMKSAHQTKLLLKDRFTADSAMQQRIIGFFAGEGIAADRIIFLARHNDWFEHMQAYNMIDIALDTTPWSSATTAFDALSMGVPMVAYQGDTTSGLMSNSVLFHLGRKEWIAKDDQEFVRICNELIENIEVVRLQRREMQGNVLCSSLFDGKDLAFQFEKLIESLE